MLDEVILCSELPYRKEWCKNLLQIKYFGHSTGGTETSISLIKLLSLKVRQDGFFSLCLLLGFSGKYYMSNNNEIDDYISKLKQQCHLNTSKEARNKFEYNKNKGESSYFNIYLPLVGIIAFLFCVIVCAVCEMISMSRGYLGCSFVLLFVYWFYLFAMVFILRNWTDTTIFLCCFYHSGNSFFKVFFGVGP